MVKHVQHKRSPVAKLAIAIGNSIEGSCYAIMELRLFSTHRKYQLAIARCG